MSLTGKLIRFACWRAARRFDAAADDPVATQNALLRDLMRRNSGTDYGRRHGFGSVRGFADYQRQVPIVTYNDIAGDIDRVVAGERNVLTAEDPVMFAQTSGTTGKPKLIPVVPSEQKGPHKDQTRVWIWHASRDHPGLLDGKVVTLVSPAVEGVTGRGLPYGSRAIG
jgi:acyl-coenzyme A synthetase/AMP-(fatty) acid ligase